MTQDREDRFEPAVDSELAAIGGPVAAGFYRELLASFPAGVCVVTAFDAEGHPRGLTLIAFCGVSLDPPLVLVCVDRSSNTLPAILHSGGFTVNVVSADSHKLARLMAGKGDDKFAGVAWTHPDQPNAGPVLHEDSAAHLLCTTRNSVEAGDHWVFIGEVIGGGLDSSRTPLVFHRRTFVDLGAERPE